MRMLGTTPFTKPETPAAAGIATPAAAAAGIARQTSIWSIAVFGRLTPHRLIRYHP